jgi:hypothetical protein
MFLIERKQASAFNTKINFFDLDNPSFFRLRMLGFFLFWAGTGSINAQQTIIKVFESDTLSLNCTACSTSLHNMALIEGQQPLPHNLEEPVKLNLLDWRYYDDISGEYIRMTERPLFGEQVNQLLDTVPGLRGIQLHVNATVTDTSGETIELYIALGGINRAELNTLPLLFHYDQIPDSERRFVAVAQMMVTDLRGNRKRTTFESNDGTATLLQFDPRNGKMEIEFTFTGSKAGEHRDRVFLGGYFRR